jgi:two-component system phosphate regulon response regulator OmpR
MGAAGQSQGPRIIVVDDDPGLRDMVRDYLSQHGFDVRTAGGGDELDRLLSDRGADLVLLDVSMPGEDGFSVARRIRAADGALPIVMLTAMGEVVDRVVGLELGTDDYIVKPFDLRELRARLGAVLRRTMDSARSPGDARETTVATASPRRVAFGKVVLDLDARLLVRADGGVERLTAMEFDLLQAFAQNPNRVLSRDRLLDLAHRKNMEPFDRSIDIRIARLRRKIEEDPSKPQIIKTERGAGYIFVAARGSP